MSLDFPYPANPGDTYLAPNGVTYTYDGTKWEGENTPIQGATGPTGDTGPTGATGPTASMILTTSTTTDLTNAAASVNTSGKSQGLMVYNTTNNLIYVASGSNAGDAWYPSDGGSQLDPI